MCDVNTDIRLRKEKKRTRLKRTAFTRNKTFLILASRFLVPATKHTTALCTTAMHTRQNLFLENDRSQYSRPNIYSVEKTNPRFQRTNGTENCPGSACYIRPRIVKLGVEGGFIRHERNSSKTNFNDRSSNVCTIGSYIKEL